MKSSKRTVTFAAIQPSCHNLRLKNNYRIQAFIMKTVRLLASLVTVVVALAPWGAWDASSCTDITQAKCKLRLNTGIEMAYLEVGPTDGPDVIFIHGFTDTSRSWAPTMEALRHLHPQLHMFALELRGHGGTSMPPASTCATAPWQCFSMHDLANDCVAFMKAKGILRAALVGHSLGSLVAQQLALDHPSMVSQLVLVGTAGETNDNASLKDWLWVKIVNGEWRKRLTEKGYKWSTDVYDLPMSSAQPSVREWLLKSWDPDTVVNPELLSIIVSEAAQIRLGTWIGVTAALLRVDNTERLKHLRVPVLIVWRVQDVWFYGAVQHGLIEAVNKAAQAGYTSFYWKQYGVIPLPTPDAQQKDIGHFVQWDAPEGLATDIGSFVTKGRPTDDLYRSAWPHDVRHIVKERGKGIIIHQP